MCVHVGRSALFGMCVHAGRSALCVHLCRPVCLVCASVSVGLPCVCMCAGRAA